MTGQTALPPPLRVAIASPVAEDLIAGINTDGVEVDFRPDLLPPQRWIADHAGDPAFRRDAAQDSEFWAMLEAADVLYGLPGDSPEWLRRAVRSNPSLRWVQCTAAGAGAQVREANLTQRERYRVVFTTSAGVHASALAEYAIFGLLCGAKCLPRLVRQQSAKFWSGRWPMAQLGNQTVLVVGLGRIGSAIAQKARALGARVIAVNQDPVDNRDVSDVFGPESLGDAVRQADAIALALPDTPNTKALFNSEILSACRQGTSLVNVGRGTVVDEGALLAALDSGIIAFAVLDVFNQEPLPPESPFWSHPSVLLSPHTAALTLTEDSQIIELFNRNLRAFLADQPLENVVDPVLLY
jgi:phosphoglycerate dehydrogenase-like enzyme